MKLFTVAEANALLPAVREILKKIQDARRKLASYRNEAKAAAEQAEQGGGGFSDGLRYADLLIDLTSQTNELEVLGVQLKDFDRGLVDFPHWRDGREVFLCWEVSEARVGYWHELHTGYAHREPV